MEHQRTSLGRLSSKSLLARTLRSVIDDRTFGVVAANAAERADVDALISDARLSDDAVVILDAGKLATFVSGVAS